MLDKDLKGNVIDQRTKDGHSTEVDGTSRFCGHRFLLKTRLYGDKRCVYCGKWFHWKDTDYFKWIQEQNIDRMNNLDGMLEPLHCDSDHCREYHYLCLKADADRKAKDELEADERAWRMFRSLKSQGRIS